MLVDTNLLRNSPELANAVYCIAASLRSSQREVPVASDDCLMTLSAHRPIGLPPRQREYLLRDYQDAHKIRIIVYKCNIIIYVFLK